ncbi:siderophore-interacting protein [Streptosporangium carneum]|uniref:Siderophore-interacting protein n=1 Tax=Streptosporangium carneum TaxID=47481 RepID=A0A9W6I6U1_9ACTN|nr:siderophore-interacting protein [Streptosporangium carneum]GLK12708.1 siderophore-interacting protein [Streptosporangium carneum]
MSSVRRPHPDLVDEREPEAWQFPRVEVVRVASVTPRMTRITFALDGFVPDLPDQHFKIFFPRGRTDGPVVPIGPDWYRRLRAVPPERRPDMRLYTIREIRPGEVDVDFVLHGDEGPGSRFALNARPGDVVGIYGPVGTYLPLPKDDWVLLVGDETGLPAIGAILESLPEGLPVMVFAEIADAAERQPLRSAGELTLTWLHRDGRPAGGTDLLPEAVRRAVFPKGRGYAWVAAESAAVKAVRRHLVGERGFAKEDVEFAGYWSHGEVDEL